jgi:hypothetical protein
VSSCVPLYNTMRPLGADFVTAPDGKMEKPEVNR